MTIRQYLASKGVTLCFWGIGAAVAAIYMAVLGVPGIQIGVAELLLLLGILTWLFCCYGLEQSRIRKLKRIRDELPDKLLLGEVLPAPVDAVEKLYFDIMKTVSRSAIGLAEQSLREKEDYCAYVESWIHEIKTPLTACSLILANDGDVRKLRRELKRADNLTESILYYARMRTAENDTQIRKIQAASLMDEAVQNQMELLVAAGIGVELQGDFTLYSDAKAVAFILQQLLINCAKYCPGCRVRLSAANGVITVEDNGIGIPDHELRRVTERGFTGTNGRRLGGSTGMGLYIVGELCKKLDIALSFESEQGAYTRVRLTFENLTKL